jgi:pyruvate/2-oxoacid:ferredoxin oxidoreductase beta subunit
LYEHREGITTYTAGTQRIIHGKARRLPVEEYLKAQGRFRHLFYPERDEERIAEIQRRVDRVFETLEFTHRLKQHIMDIEMLPPR